MTCLLKFFLLSNVILSRNSLVEIPSDSANNQYHSSSSFEALHLRDATFSRSHTEETSSDLGLRSLNPANMDIQFLKRDQGPCERS